MTRLGGQIGGLSGSGGKPSRAIGLHEAGGRVRAVAAVVGGTSVAGGVVRVVETSTCPSDAASVAAMIQRLTGALAAGSGGSASVAAGGGATDGSGTSGSAGSGEVLIARVLEPGVTILRPVPSTGSVQIGSNAGEQAAALALLAEAQLPETLAVHRRCAGVLRHGGARGLVAVGWSGADDVGGAGGPTGVAAGSVMVPSVAAAVGLMRVVLPQGGVVASGQRGNAGGVWTLAACSSSVEGPITARLVRVGGGGGSEDDGAVLDAIEETGESLETSFTPVLIDGEDGARLVLSDDPASVAGLGRERLAGFGLALGAAVFAAQAQGDERPLLSMLAARPVIKRAPGVSLAARLGHGSTLAKVSIAGVLLLLGGWVGAQHVRRWSLEKRAGESAADAAAFARAVDQQQLMVLLRERRWPMTHLLSQVTSVMPEGVLIDSVQLEHGRPLLMTGVAPDAEAVNQWRAALSADRSLKDVSVPQQSPGGDGVSVRFSISARVEDPLAGVKVGGGGAARPGAGRSGSGGSSSAGSDTSAAPAATRATSAPATPRANAPTARGGAAGPDAGATGTGGAGAEASRAEPPPALTEAQIARMTMAEATSAWARRRGWSQNQTIDETTRARLTTELELLQRRRDELRQSGGGN